jgi:hypothetical protein
MMAASAGSLLCTFPPYPDHEPGRVAMTIAIVQEEPGAFS